MTHLRFRESGLELDRYPEDVERMYRALEALGYTADHVDIVRAWRAYSEDRGAGWLVSSNLTEGQLSAALLSHMERVKGEPSE